MTTRHRAARVAQAGASLTVEPVSPRAPTALEVRVDVVGSGICGADAGTVTDPTPPAGFPVVPGHEVAGVIAEIGTGVEHWSVGDRVSVGWFGGSCGGCDQCRAGNLVHCPERQVPGVSYPGGWATTITVPASSLARIPDALTFTEAAPFGCAGVTTFTAVRDALVPIGGRVAVVGVGGLGHLALQFAARSGYETVAVGRGGAKKADAFALGAHHYIDARETRPGSGLRSLGGADHIIFTAPSSDGIAELVDGLRPRGRLTVLGVGPDPATVPLSKLVAHAHTLAGHLTGTPVQTEAAMHCAVLFGIRPWIDTVPLDEAVQGLARQQSGQARYRVVLTTDVTAPT